MDFYNAISILFGTLEEFCTARTCPVMSAGPKVRPPFGQRVQRFISNQGIHALRCCHSSSCRQFPGTQAPVAHKIASCTCCCQTSEQATMPAVQYEYLWADGMKIKKPTRMSAPEYINSLFDWIESQVGGLLLLVVAPVAASCLMLLTDCFVRVALYICRCLVACHGSTNQLRLSQAALSLLSESICCTHIVQSVLLMVP